MCWKAVLPGFAAEVKNAARIHIVSHEGDFQVTYTPQAGWVLPGQGNYPADLDEVRHTLIGLAALEKVEPKTARADWLSYVGLERPPKGNGILITVSDANGKELASLITGNSQPLGEAGGATGLFVRKPAENQSWLARAVYVPHARVQDWMLLRILEIQPARLKEVRFAPDARPAFTITREHVSDIHYNILPARPVNQGIVDLLPTAITEFTAGDVRPAADIIFVKSSHVTARTFDGLIVEIEAAMVNNEPWARLSATATPGAARPVQEEARALSARAAGWAYKLITDKGRILMVTDNMLHGGAK